MTLIEQQKITLDLIEEFQAYLASKRLERGEGCVASGCSAGRGADKDQHVAEQRSDQCPNCYQEWYEGVEDECHLRSRCGFAQGSDRGASIAAHVPPVQAEDILERMIRRWGAAENMHLSLSRKYEREKEYSLSSSCQRAAEAYRTCILDLNRVLSESRKANASQPLEQDESNTSTNAEKNG